MTWTDQEVGQLYRDATAGVGGCPPAETLARALGGELMQAEAKAVVDHLAGCADCGEDAQALRALEPWAGRAALAAGGAHAPSSRTAQATAAPGPWNKPWLGLTAALLLVAAGLSTGLLHERTGMPAAVPNLPIVDLQPASASPASAVVPVNVPAAATLVACVLTVPRETPAYGDHAIEVWSGGRLVFRAQGLRRSAQDAFTIALPVRLLEGGQGRIRLAGLDHGRAVPVAEYALSLHAS